MIAELDENSTTEDISAYINNIVDERKPDAEIIAEHNESTETPADDNSGGEEVEETSEEDSGWINDDLIAEVADYDLDKDDLAEFGSREELDRALKLFNKQAVAASRDPEEAEPKTDESKSQYESLDEDIYDEEIVGMGNQFNERIAALEAQLQGKIEQAAERKFDSAIESLEHTELFGKTGSETKKQMEHRTKVNAAVRKQLGGSDVSDEEHDKWVRIIARGIFAEEFDKRVIKNHTQKISKQSGKRQGGGATRASEAPESPRDAIAREAREIRGY